MVMRSTMGQSQSPSFSCYAACCVLIFLLVLIAGSAKLFWLSFLIDPCFYHVAGTNMTRPSVSTGSVSKSGRKPSSLACLIRSS